MPVSYLAGEILASRPDILFIARDAGLATAVRAYFAGSHCLGGCGRGDDGMFRRWDFDGPRVLFRTGTFDADPVIVPLREVLAWSLARVSPAAWSELEQLRRARSDTLQVEYGDPDLSHRMTYRPKDVTPAERATVAEAYTRRREAERASHDLLAGLLAATEDAVGQLDMFGSSAAEPGQLGAQLPDPVELPGGQFALFDPTQVRAA